jgi:hypothetical protein
MSAKSVLNVNYFSRLLYSAPVHRTPAIKGLFLLACCINYSRFILPPLITLLRCKPRPSGQSASALLHPAQSHHAGAMFNRQLRMRNLTHYQLVSTLCPSSGCSSLPSTYRRRQIYHRINLAAKLGSDSRSVR